MRAPRIEGTFKALELYMGLAILCFAAGTFVSWALMSRLFDRPDLLPAGPSRLLWLSLIHDAGYVACAPLFSFAASRIVAGDRLLPAVAFVPSCYVIEEMAVFIWGGERVYWEWPWGALGRAAAIALALGASFVATRRNSGPPAAG